MLNCSRITPTQVYCLHSAVHGGGLSWPGYIFVIGFILVVLAVVAVSGKYLLSGGGHHHGHRHDRHQRGGDPQDD